MEHVEYLREVLNGPHQSALLRYAVEEGLAAIGEKLELQRQRAEGKIRE